MKLSPSSSITLLRLNKTFKVLCILVRAFFFSSLKMYINLKAFLVKLGWVMKMNI